MFLGERKKGLIRSDIAQNRSQGRGVIAKSDGISGDCPGDVVRVHLDAREPLSSLAHRSVARYTRAHAPGRSTLIE